RRAMAAEEAQRHLLGQAQAAEKRAVAAALEARDALAASDFLEATRLISEQDGVDALAYLQRSFTLNPSNDAPLTRMALLLSYHTWMLPLLALKHTDVVSSAEFSPDGKLIVTA